MSDQYHHSEQFAFSEEYDRQRMNLTMLFGDRLGPESQQSVVQECEEGAWNIFSEVARNTKEDWDIFN